MCRLASSTLNFKIIDSGIRESAPPAEEDDESEDEWIDGDDYPQYVNHDETWKTITASDMKRCITRFFEDADETVVEGGRRVMPRVIPVSPPMTEDTRRKLKEAIQVLNNAVAEGKGELRIVSAETLWTDCSCKE